MCSFPSVSWTWVGDAEDRRQRASLGNGRGMKTKQRVAVPGRATGSEVLVQSSGQQETAEITGAGKQTADHGLQMQ